MIGINQLRLPSAHPRVNSTSSLNVTREAYQIGEQHDFEEGRGAAHPQARRRTT